MGINAEPRSAEEREEVFKDWASRKYETIAQLAEAYGIPSVDTIQSWIKRYNWGERRAEYVEEIFAKDEKRRSTINEANEMHIQGWRVLFHQAMNLIQPKKNKAGRLIPVDAMVLEKVSGVLTRAQKGHRLSIGSDLSGNQDRSKRIRVTIGDGDTPSDLKGLAKEVIEQHDEAHKQDKKVAG